MALQIGDKVTKNPTTWIADDVDAWGRGIGVGEIVDAQGSTADLGAAAVHWPAGRCMERLDGLQSAPK